MNPQLISDAADKFGSQCVVVAIDARGIVMVIGAYIRMAEELICIWML